MCDANTSHRLSFKASYYLLCIFAKAARRERKKLDTIIRVAPWARQGKAKPGHARTGQKEDFHSAEAMTQRRAGARAGVADCFIHSLHANRYLAAAALLVSNFTLDDTARGETC